MSNPDCNYWLYWHRLFARRIIFFFFGPKYMHATARSFIDSWLTVAGDVILVSSFKNRSISRQNSIVQSFPVSFFPSSVAHKSEAHLEILPTDAKLVRVLSTFISSLHVFFRAFLNGKNQSNWITWPATANDLCRRKIAFSISNSDRILVSIYIERNFLNSCLRLD